MARAAREFDLRDAHVRILNWRNLLRIDWLMPIFVIALAVTGWLTMYSASRSTDPVYFQKQVNFFFAGAVVCLLVVCVDYRFLVAMAPAMYVVSLLLLLGVEFAGEVRKGSERWLTLGPITLQPSEIAKITMVYALTWYFYMLGERIRRLHWFLLTFLIAGLPMALILKQPNLGTAACLAPLLIVMLYVAGCRFWHVAVVVLIGLSALPVLAWQMYDFDPNNLSNEPRPFYELKDYQKLRIYAFLNPGYDPRGSGWHTTQSMITVGSGGLSGKGFLEGTQTRLNYLPEHHTDFIFSLLAEERGFIGAAVVIGLFAAFLMRGLQFSRDCPDMQGTLLATGIVTVLAFHIFVNIAITVGLAPVTGIPLPFLSYGGTFYITTMICVGILLNVPMRRRLFVR